MNDLPKVGRSSSCFRFLRLLTIAGLAVGSLGRAADKTWNGNAGDGFFHTGGNWDGGNPPSNNDWQDTAVFGSAATAGTVTLSTSRSIKGIDFDTSGWTLTGSSFSNVGAITSSGSGTNSIGSSLTLSGNRTWNVASGNTLEVTSSLYMRNNIITLTGGGQLTIDNSLGGYSSGTWGINVGDAVLRMNNSDLFSGTASSNAAIRLTSEDAVFRFTGTTSQATSHISSGRIIDMTGEGLDVVDLGGNLVQVTPQSSAPPPPPTIPVVSGEVAWTGGAGDGVYQTGGNWNTGNAPSNNDWQHIAVFGSPSTSTTVNLTSNRSVKGLRFDSAGWTLSGSSFSNIGPIESGGSGTNTIGSGLSLKYNRTWTVQTGNQLHLMGSLYMRNYSITLTGGGYLRLTNSLGGYGSGTWGIELEDALLQIDKASLFSGGTSSNAAIWLTHPDSALVFAGTVSQANSYISNGTIVDMTGLGLDVMSDSGGNYVQVAPVAGDPLPLIPGDWQLEFEDNFSGNSVDGDKWRLGQHWSGIAGPANVDPDNVHVEDGKLHITMEQRSTSYGGSTKSYATGEISTFTEFRQLRGAFEARIRYPAVTGLWPAFWLMPDRAQYGWRDNHYRSYVKFDLTGVSPGAISSAQLKMKVSSMDTGGENNVVFMRLRDDSWQESQLTWNNAPTPDPIWIEQKWHQATVGSDMTVDVSDFITEQMDGDKVISFVLADTFMRTKAVRFHSREAANQADRPRLVINGVTYYASEDATIRWGTKADDNYPSGTQLTVREDWGDTANTYNGGMEIDIMESLGIWGADKTAHAMHWDGYGGSHQYTGSGIKSFPSTSDDFHVYGLKWESGHLEFYVDGVKTYEWTNSEVMSVPAYMILSLQAGGWDNNNVGSQVDNQVMEVDWVRVWSEAP
jgi:beta-glucanase (GH16 family)